MHKTDYKSSNEPHLSGTGTISDGTFTMTGKDGAGVLYVYGIISEGTFIVNAKTVIDNGKAV